MQRSKFAWLLLLVSSFWLGALSLPAMAQDRILSRSFLADPTNLASYDEVKQQLFTPYDDFFNGGYYSGSFWIKVELAPSTEDLVLRVKPPYIDDIDVYHQGKLLYSIEDGGHRAGSQSTLTALPYAFAIPPSGDVTDVYLRFKSGHSYQILIDALPVAEFSKKDHIERLIYTGYTTFSLTLALWLFIMWLLDRNMVVGVFTLQQFIAFIHSFITAGFSQFFFAETTVSPYLINYLGFLVIVTYPLVGFIANKLLLSELGLKRIYVHISNALIGCSLVVIALFLLGDLSVIKWNALLVLTGITFFWIAAMFGLTAQSMMRPAERFLGSSLKVYFSLILVIWIIAILPLLGVWNIGLLAFQLLFAYNVLSGLMLFFLLQARYKYRLANELAIRSELQAQAAAEKKEREELGMMMAMLSHEIKTPLSVLKLVVDDRIKGSELEGHATRAINNIRFVINRCLQLGKLDSHAIRTDVSTFKVAPTIKAVLQDLGPSAQKRVQLTGNTELTITTDINIFGVVASNLIDNALKYSPAESTVTVRLSRMRTGRATGLTLMVANRVGALGSPETSQVFKKYYRNTAATKIAGSGLGLYLVSRLVQVLGGQIDYVPRKEYVTFVVRIPN